MYEPIADELTPNETQFLRLVAPMGLDWLVTRRDFAARYGVTRYYDWADVIALPPSTALTGSRGRVACSNLPRLRANT